MPGESRLGEPVLSKMHRYGIRNFVKGIDSVVGSLTDLRYQLLHYRAVLITAMIVRKNQGAHPLCQPAKRLLPISLLILPISVLPFPFTSLAECGEVSQSWIEFGSGSSE